MPREGGTSRGARAAALVVAIGAIAFAAVYVARARPPATGPSGASASTASSGAVASSASSPTPASSAPASATGPSPSAASGPRVLFRSVEPEPAGAFGKLAVAPLEGALDAGAARPGGRALQELACVRVHFAGDRGLCLSVLDEGVREATLVVFDGAFRRLWSTPISGIPSRARVSADGRYGAVTVFVTGHSYDDGTFSTRTSLVDLRELRVVVDDLERLRVRKSGATFEPPERNFWGVTFAPTGSAFHATLGVGDQRWLVSGDVTSSALEVLRANVECPSRSPDGKRLAFKKHLEGQDGTRLHVLDLATLEDRPLGEPRSIDDQVEWLDDARVLYKRGADIQVLGIGEGSEPEVFLERASSPAVVR